MEEEVLPRHLTATFYGKGGSYKRSGIHGKLGHQRTRARSQETKRRDPEADWDNK